MTTLHDFGGVLGRPLDTSLLGSHNSMVTALGSCVKWPLWLKRRSASMSRIGSLFGSRFCSKGSIKHGGDKGV